MMKTVKAPKGFHWMKKGSGYNLMKHSGTMKAKKLAKKYPKSAAAITGAVGYDIFDSD